MSKNSSNMTLSEQLNRPFKYRSRLGHSDKISNQENTTKVTANKNDDKSPESSNTEKAIAALTSTIQTQYGGMRHPTYTQKRKPIDPNRPLDKITKPTPRYHEQVQQVLHARLTRDLQSFDVNPAHSSSHNQSRPNESKTFARANNEGENRFLYASPWALIASPELASHLELLQVGGLIDLPQQFFEPIKPPAHKKALPKNLPEDSTSMACMTEDGAKLENQLAHLGSKPTFNDKVLSNDANKLNVKVEECNRDTAEKSLLLPLKDMILLDLSDIFPICAKYPLLTRYGFQHEEHGSTAQDCVSNMPEITNDIFSPNWEVILYPERFDNGVDSLSTDILACSTAVHILKQCSIRQTVNRRLNTQQICQYMRSYVLSQCNLFPQYESTYRQIRLFEGHVLVAAYYLGLNVSQNKSQSNHKTGNVTNKLLASQLNANVDELSGKFEGEGSAYINVSSRSALFIRYPNIHEFYINGWS